MSRRKECRGGAARLTVRFEGRVQGVGFRYTTVELARDFDVTGMVRNESDGSVRVIVEGTRAEIEPFVHQIKTSFVGRHITAEHRNWTNATGEYSGFTVGHTW